MVDSIYLRFAEVVLYLFVQCNSAFEVAAKRLFHDEFRTSSALGGTLTGQPRVSEMFDNRSIDRGRHGEVIDVVASGGVFHVNIDDPAGDFWLYGGIVIGCGDTVVSLAT